MKYLFPLIVVLLLASTSFIGVSYKVKKTSNVSSDVIILYVGGSGEGNYTKIQDAIDNASDGDTVFVYNGNYVENVVVDKSIKLIGEDSNTTLINGNKSGYVVNISADWVNISCFTIQNSGGYEYAGIYLQSNKNNISFNILSNNNIGIYLRESMNNIIFHNSILGDTDGYGIYDGSLYYFQGSNNNTIFGNNISDCDAGIYLGRANNLTISGNEISNNHDGIVFVRGVSHSIISANIISDNVLGIEIGLSCTHNLISRNIFQNNNESVIVYTSWRNNISENVFIDNSCGVSLFYLSQNNKIYHNNFINNKKDAFFYGLSLYNKWEGNYWGRSRILPKPIFGNAGFILPFLIAFGRPLYYIFHLFILYVFFILEYIPSWVNFDWHPAKEPYDIGG